MAVDHPGRAGGADHHRRGHGQEEVDAAAYDRPGGCDDNHQTDHHDAPDHHQADHHDHASNDNHIDAPTDPGTAYHRSPHRATDNAVRAPGDRRPHGQRAAATGNDPREWRRPDGGHLRRRFQQHRDRVGGLFAPRRRQPLDLLAGRGSGARPPRHPQITPL